MADIDRELRDTLEAFAASGWDELALPARQFLAGKPSAAALREAILRAQAVCGTCGCALDALYPRALVLLEGFGHLCDKTGT